MAPAASHPAVMVYRHAGRHYGGQATARKVLRVGIWWHTLHNDAIDYAQSNDICQLTGKTSRWDEMLLVP